MSSQKQVVPEPIIVEDAEETYDMFLDQDEDPSDSQNPGLSRNEYTGMDRSNILNGDRTRHAMPQSQSQYDERDEDDLPDSE
ncbi:hypothetical protein N7466_004494 [Penicillium verhagenii]|uniref:uncharacterized protein n=1 Tax=Penicillium verhagenii TaxID=1562060 RepID=UPI002545AEB4|nr:uncharacterized protein N7466_004494 [Penicillium verhagenii]KAJ5934947.1 hypothetical protein N7466_004494 [Penicillium verhagenii]